MKIARSHQGTGAKLLLLALPLGVSFAWGDYFPDAAFTAFNQARYWVGDGLIGGLVAQVSLAEPSWLAHSPFFLLILTGLAKLDGALPVCMRLLTGMGWGATAVAVYAMGRGVKRPFSGFAAGLLVAVSPALLLGLGTAVSWTMAWAWLALARVALSPKRPPWLFLGLLLVTWLGFDSLIFTVLLWLLARFVRYRWMQAASFLLLGASVLGAVFWRSDNFESLVAHFSQYDQFLWLLLPLLLVGLLAAFIKSRDYPVLIAALVWPPLALLWGGNTAVAAFAILSFFLMGLGMTQIVQWLQDHALVKSKKPSYGRILLALLALPPLAAQAFALQRQFQRRPLVRAQLERETGDWLHEATDADVTLLADPAVVFWAGRTVVSGLDGAWGAGTADYVVLSRHVASDQLMRTNWFQERYEALTEFASPYSAASPYVVWGYRPTVYGLGSGQPLNVRASDVVEVVGYQLEPARVLPGETITATLHFKLLQPLTAPILATLRLSALPDGQIATQSEQLVPGGQTAEQWLPGQVITERLTIAAPPDLPVGAYAVNFSLGQSSEIWPLYRNNDANMLDRAALGTTAVPWQGEFDNAIISNARFGEAIRLASFEVADESQPGETLVVRLYWEALSQPEKSHAVFVHLLDEVGNLVGSHDSAPRDGRFPTNTWLSGDLIQDNHTIQLDVGLPSGEYQIKVGLYLPETGERLPAQTGNGEDIPEKSLPLTTIRLP
ncbi:MAG: DUF4401 domain-containing protein [Chloroflexi bacterium]|nr:DUF4401 domain-containing protein [Chloroflexota bacterium]